MVGPDSNLPLVALSPLAKELALALATITAPLRQQYT